MKISRQLAVDKNGRKVNNGPKSYMSDDISVPVTSDEYANFRDANPDLKTETRRIVIDVYDVPVDLPNDVLPIDKDNMAIVESRRVLYNNSDPSMSYQDTADVFKGIVVGDDPCRLALTSNTIEMIKADDNGDIMANDDYTPCEDYDEDSCEGCKYNRPTWEAVDESLTSPAGFAEDERRLALKMQDVAHGIAEVVADKFCDDMSEAVHKAFHTLMDGAVFTAFAGAANTRKQLYHLVNPDADLCH